MIRDLSLEAIAEAIPVDFGGGSSIHKLKVMAGLATRLGLQTYVEIGVYRGRSFFPIAHSFAKRNGFSYGIDPYTKEDAFEHDAPEDVEGSLRQFFKETDYNALYREVLDRQLAFGLLNRTEIFRLTSHRAVETLLSRHIMPDMVHIDGNHDTKCVIQDVTEYTSLLQDGGVLVLDDTDWESVQPAFEFAQKHLTEIFVAETFAIFVKSDVDGLTARELAAHCRQIASSTSRQSNETMEDDRKAVTPKISVSMITFNHKDYIAIAIESALKQITDFDFEIVIGDDKSTDGTVEICRRYQTRYPEKIRFFERGKNVGAVRNYLDIYQKCAGQYVAFLEGDDFWIDAQKLQKQADFLDDNSDYAICFHNVLQCSDLGELGAPLFRWLPDTTTVRDLCTGDYISTPSCMIRNRQVQEIPEWIYELPGCDWPFDILNAERGKIKYLPEPMAAYRSHGSSIWSSLSTAEKSRVAIDLASEVNRGLHFRYDREFQYFIARNRVTLDRSKDEQLQAALATQLIDRRQFEERIIALESRFEAGFLAIAESMPHVKRRLVNRIVANLYQRFTRHSKPLTKSLAKKWKAATSQPQDDLLIVDDAYPHPQSAFRKEEFDAYLAVFNRSKVYTTGEAFGFFSETRPLSAVIYEHERGTDGISGRVIEHDPSRRVSARLAYSIFAGNTWMNVEFYERNDLPFVFTLYPGGSFFMDDAASDARLRRIFTSPMFRRVIVTQEVTRSYLLQKEMCKSDKIELIYGVVTPQINLRKDALAHQHFGFEKETFDICFTAHKYSNDGRDKGYDIFLEVAKTLAPILPQSHFHVVGGYSADDLSIEGLEGRISFYGGQTQEWLSKFYENKDIILLCNVPFVLRPGSFDGFPTGCGSDAMLNKVALMCTDILKMNIKFVDGRDVIIVPHDASVITDKLLWLAHNPAALRSIAESGKKAAERVYSFENQLKPRIAVLKKEMREWKLVTPKAVMNVLKRARLGLKKNRWIARLRLAFALRV